MKTLGILGGMSWESTASYYQLINEGVKQQLGGFHSAELLLRSVDFAQIEAWQAKGDWNAAADYLAVAAKQLATAGADGLIIATNTMHKVADQITEQLPIPLLHIADCTAEYVLESELKTVGLLGTAFTMEQAFYKNRLSEKFGIEVITPNAQARQRVHDIIYNELCLGKINTDSQSEYARITADLAEQGAEAVILGCTEIGLLLTEAVTDVPLIDTTRIHAQKAVAWMLD